MTNKDGGIITGPVGGEFMVIPEQSCDFVCFPVFLCVFDMCLCS